MRKFTNIVLLTTVKKKEEKEKEKEKRKEGRNYEVGTYKLKRLLN